jgi:hypothetical protein
LRLRRRLRQGWCVQSGAAIRSNLSHRSEVSGVKTMRSVARNLAARKHGARNPVARMRGATKHGAKSHVGMTRGGMRSRVNRTAAEAMLLRRAAAIVARAAGGAVLAKVRRLADRDAALVRRWAAGVPMGPEVRTVRRVRGRLA